MELSMGTVTTLGDLLDQRAAQTPTALAIVLPGDRATYGELAASADYYSRALMGLGIQAGDNVGLLLPPLTDYVAAMFGAAKIGAVPVLMNARFKTRELRHVVTNGDLRIVLTSTQGSDVVDFPALLLDAIPDLANRNPAASDQDTGFLSGADAPLLRNVVLVDDIARDGFIGQVELDDAAESVSSDDVDTRQRRVRVGDVGLIMYTSGTTAAPKGAMLTHDALVRQGHLVGQTRFGLTEADRVWTPLPLFHIGGMSFVITCIVAGCTMVHAGYFDADVSLAQLVDERCTLALPAFETMWLQILDHPDFASSDLSSIRLVLAVGVPERLRSMQERFPQAPMVTTFGGTESTSHLSLALADDPPETRLTTGGHPLPGIEVRICDPDTRADLGPSERGEIVFRGWNRFVGYYNDPERTAEVIDADGWFHSGDIGTLDADGRLTYVGRIKDMLKVGGENVAAAEIEGFLLEHPAVQIVQVVSAPDAAYTEVAAAFIELKPGATVTEEELINYCRGQIATFKVPRYVRFIDEWPMSGTKIKKFELRDRIARELAASGITEAPRISSS
ncbi:MAG: fatty-acyl-CoA synthase [Ilumatobacter sp.]|jgi:fatty-acyl-CoA synthase